MRDAVRQALMIGPDPSTEDRTIDITTTGRRSGEARRIEIVFYRFENTVCLSGIPRRAPRSWLLNLADHPSLTFHLKHAAVADPPATATVIAESAERRRILGRFTEEFNARWTPADGALSAIRRSETVVRTAAR